jgi:hypothetical protein
MTGPPLLPVNARRGSAASLSTLVRCSACHTRIDGRVDLDGQEHVGVEALCVLRQVDAADDPLRQAQVATAYWVPASAVQVRTSTTQSPRPRPHPPDDRDLILDAAEPSEGDLRDPHPELVRLHRLGNTTAHGSASGIASLSLQDGTGNVRCTSLTSNARSHPSPSHSTRARCFFVSPRLSTWAIAQGKATSGLGSRT